jgi:hypothetical protein
MRGQLFKPFLIVTMQSRFVIVDEDGSGDMHGIHQQKAFGNAAFSQASLDLGSDVDKPPSAWDVKPQLFSERFHGYSSSHFSA